MAVLTKADFKERLERPITDLGCLVITPLPSDDVFTEDSIDLRLGTHFLMPQIPPQPFVDPGATESSRNYLQLHAPLGGYFVLPAHQTVLGATLEYIKLPCDVSGEILTKSSVARTFMIIETAPWVHPNYRGCLTLEIANASNTAILLYPGMPIGQLILMGTSNDNCKTDEAEKAKKLSGSYIGPIYPEAPRLKQPQAMLAKMGITKYCRPGVGWIAPDEMRKELERVSLTLTPDEKAKVNSVIQIIAETGELPTNSPALNLFR